MEDEWDKEGMWRAVKMEDEWDQEGMWEGGKDGR